MGTRGELLNGAVFPTEHDEDGNAASANVTVNMYRGANVGQFQGSLLRNIGPFRQLSFSLAK